MAHPYLTIVSPSSNLPGVFAGPCIVTVLKLSKASISLLSPAVIVISLSLLLRRKLRGGRNPVTMAGGSAIKKIAINL